MKKFVALLLLGAVAGISPAYASKKESSIKSPASIAEARKKVETLKADLNGSSWEITLAPTDGKGKELRDELIFQNNQISLKGFSDKGFKPTNYTITPTAIEGNPAVWETMQTSDKDGLLFVRGEWKEKEQVMHGIISRQKEGEPSTDYNFTSQAKVTLEPSKDKAAGEAEAGVAPAAPETANGKVQVSKESNRK